VYDDVVRTGWKGRDYRERMGWGGKMRRKRIENDDDNGRKTALKKVDIFKNVGYYIHVRNFLLT
jgi:hypothetical protein